MPGAFPAGVRTAPPAQTVRGQCEEQYVAMSLPASLTVGLARAVLVVAALALGEGGDLASGVSAASFAAWLYLALFGSLVAFTAYAWLLQNAPISQVVTHQYVNPLVAIVLGAVVLGETFDATTIVGALIVIGAVFATIRSETRTTTPVRRRRRAAALRTPGAREVGAGASTPGRRGCDGARGTRAGRSGSGSRRAGRRSRRRPQRSGPTGRRRPRRARRARRPR